MLLLLACTGDPPDTDESDTEVIVDSCHPTAECSTVTSDCLALADNQPESTFMLRMSELDFETPASLSTGITATMLKANMLPNLSDCHLDGIGTFTWLVEFDHGTDTIRTGAGYPVDDPHLGYQFVDT